jgi:hypothetical protein
MADLLPLLRSESFEPEVTSAMGAAFERACATLVGGERSDRVREMVAGRIIDLARRGCRDADALYEGVLKSLGMEISEVEALVMESTGKGAKAPERKI